MPTSTRTLLESRLAGMLVSTSGPLALLLTASACVAVHDGSNPVSAQRPTLSSDTATTVEGTFELEMGVSWDPDELVDTPSSLKYGAGPSTEVFLGWSPYLDNELTGDTGIGDLAIGVRHRFQQETDSLPSAAVQSTIKLPTADDGLGSGQVDASFAGILTKTFGRCTATSFYQLGVRSDAAGGSNVAHSLALAAATPMFGRFGAFGEIAGVVVPETNSESYFSTVGITYNPRASLVFDLGLLTGWNDEAPDTQIYIGFTHNLGGHSWK